MGINCIRLCSFVLLFFLLGCGNSSKSSRNEIKEISLKSKSFYWQLDGDINLSRNEDIYDIDLFNTSKKIIDKLHKKNKIVICYFSAGSYEDVREDKDKFSKDIIGKPLKGWDGEYWLDISKIYKLAPIMKARLDLAKSKGCDGVEVDNVDGYLNDTGFGLTYNDQLKYNRFLSSEAHKRGMVILLKNDLLQAKDLSEDFDGILMEECIKYNECNLSQPFKDKFRVDVEYIENENNITSICNLAPDYLDVYLATYDLNGTFFSCKNYIYNDFKVGIGNNAYRFYNNIWLDLLDVIFDRYDGYKTKIEDFNKNRFHKLSSYLSHSKYFIEWFPKGWQEEWYNKDKIQLAIKNGKIPIFIYFYFGDDLRLGIDEDDLDDYKKDVNRFAKFVNFFNGEKIIILEPEFNKENILNNKNEQTLFIKAIDYAIDKLKSNKTKISLCMMDTGRRDKNSIDTCGYENCAYGDKVEWQRVDSIYSKLIDKLDFISFQEFIWQFSRNPQKPDKPIAYSDDEVGIYELPQRITNFATFLKNKYKKPVMLAYMALPTATWIDKNRDGEIDKDEVNATGWINEVSYVYTHLQTKNLFAINILDLFDSPTHDEGGYQFGLENEKHLGIVTAPIKEKQLTGNIIFKDEKILKSFFNY